MSLPITDGAQKEWAERGATTTHKMSRQHILGATKKKHQCESTIEPWLRFA